MTPPFRRFVAALTSAAAMTMLSGGLPLIAQETGKAQVKTTAKKAGDPSRRVPNFFAQLRLTEAQRESIYKIQAKHQAKIDALEKQLDELRGQSLKECESVLTDVQKKMLAERRASAAELRSKRKSAGAKAKPAD